VPDASGLDAVEQVSASESNTGNRGPGLDADRRVGRRDATQPRVCCFDGVELSPALASEGVALTPSGGRAVSDVTRRALSLSVRPST
jgi:hypothetical protein